MRDNRRRSESADSIASRTRGRLRRPIPTSRRAGGLAVFVGAAAVALAAVNQADSTQAANLGKRSGSGNRAPISQLNGSGRNPAAPGSKDHAVGLLNEWATCERSNGDPHQADPTVDHRVIYIAVHTGALQNWDPNDVTATCGESLAAARRAVAGGQPIKGWGDNAKYVQYANCMRANGYPKFPYPSGRIEPDGNESTNFNGTGIDPNSRAFLNGTANQMCGTQIGAPAWWINNWGPPGSVDVYPAGANPNRPLPSALPTGPQPSIGPSRQASQARSVSVAV